MTMLSFLILFSHTHFLCGFLLDGLSSNVLRNTSVQTNVGEIVGILRDGYFDGSKYTVKEFLGIPYAEPPIGRNRFRKPIPKAPFTSPYYASDFGFSCLQQQANGLRKSEDCLYLNIFVPYITGSQLSKLPVMVWIHGGGFQHGTSTYYPGDVLCSFGKVIVVTLNYRLAHLGFLPDLEGNSNFGLWDQHLAIKWVHDNIAAFGGDTSRVTIFGESAGSSSVIYQALYAGNKNLFQRVIAESGGITSEWAYDTNTTVYEILNSFLDAISCNGSNGQIACIRNKTPAEVEFVMENFHLSIIHPNDDGDFVPQYPQEMLTPSIGLNGSINFFQGLDLMMGSNSIDGALYLPAFAHDLNITDINRLEIPRTVYEKVLIPKELANAFMEYEHIPLSVKEAAILEYTDWSDPDNSTARLKMLTKFMTDLGMIAPMVATGLSHSRGQRGRTYLFEFSMQLARHLIPVPSSIDGPLQANHGDELAYVFGFSQRMIQSMYRFRGGYNVTDQDTQKSKFVMTMWTNFARSGNPNLPVSLKPYMAATWLAYNESSQNYLEIMPVTTTSSLKQRIRASIKTYETAHDNLQQDRCDQERLKITCATILYDKTLCVDRSLNEGHAISENSDQTARMHRLIIVFACLSSLLVGFIKRCVYI